MKLFTDYKESLDLMKAGVKKETADYFFLEGSDKYIDKRLEGGPKFNYIPCWSLAALWEILHDMHPESSYCFPTAYSSEQLIERIVDIIVFEQ